jgi:signal transduction histidine kinase
MVNYVVTSIATLIVTILAGLSLAFIAYQLLFHPSSGIEKNEEALLSGKFNDLNIEEIAGVDGHIEIVDSTGNVVFPDDVDNFIPLEDVNSIPSISLLTINTITRFEFEGPDNKKQTLLAQQDFLSNDDNWFMLLDSDYKVISQSANFPFDKGELTEDEIENVVKNGTALLEYKHKFEVNGEEHYMIIHLSETIQEQNNFIFSVGVYVPLFLLLIYFIATGTFLGLLNRRITKPLSALDHAMNSYASKEDYVLESKGSPKAIANIIDTFNYLTDDLRKSEEENNKLNEDKQALIADISHDLKTPITVIKGYSKALADGVIPEGEVQKYLGIIAHKSEELTDLIDMFHVYSKMEHPKYALNFEEKDLSEVIRRYVAKEYNYITSLDINFDFEIPDNEIICGIDEFELQRAIANLVMNAVKYNPSGTKINITLKEVGDNACIFISDNGIGIDETTAKNIFLPFVVGDESRSSEHGSGLGLAITKSIIDKHHGSIALNEKIEEGFATTFKIVIPKT